MSLFFILFIFSLIISLYYEKIIDFVNIYDCPDGVRKFQKNKVPCVGGLYFYVTFLIILFYYFLSSEQSDFVVKEFLIKDIKQFILINFSITFVFFVGLYDDKYEMSSSIKTFLLLFIIFFYVYHNDQIQINHLTSSFLKRTILLGNFNLFFTSICIFTLLVSLNMFDGSNGQSVLNILSILIFLFIKGIFFNLSIIYIMIILYFAFYNFKNLAYLGDSGIYLLSFILSYLIIFNYNNDKSIYVEEIIIVLLIPVIDMVRLFVTRIYLGKNPFKPDTNHLHHIITRKYSSKKILLFLFILITLPMLAIFFVDIDHYFLILFQLFFYAYLILKKKNIHKKNYI